MLITCRVRLGCLCVHERTTRYSRSRDAAESEVINIAPCPACGSSTESLSHFVFDCPATAELRSELFDSLRRVPGGAEKLRQCLAVVDDKERVCRLVSCDFWVILKIPGLSHLLLLDFYRRHGACVIVASMVGQWVLLLLFFPLLRIRGAGPMAILLWHEG